METVESLDCGSYSGREESETDKLCKGTSNKSMYWIPRVRESVSRIIVLYNRLSLTFYIFKILRLYVHT